MKRRRAALFVAILLSAAGLPVTARSLAFQAFMSKAKKFGAKDCLFCHVLEDGGEGWNERGQWLIEQKAERKAEKIDVEWLADYKPDDKESTKPKQSDGKEKPPAPL